MKKISLILTILFLLTLCGCTASQNADGKYSAEFPYDPQQYMLFVNKELQAPINQMSDVLSAISKFEKGEVSQDGLHKLVRSTYATLTDSIRTIEFMRPPETYTADAQRVVERLNDLKALYAELIELSSAGNMAAEDASAMAERIHESYLLTTSEANTYWK